VIIIASWMVITANTSASAIQAAGVKQPFSAVSDPFDQLRSFRAMDAEMESALSHELMDQYYIEYVQLQEYAGSVEHNVLISQPNLHFYTTASMIPAVHMGVIVISQNKSDLAFHCNHASLAVYGNFNKLRLSGICSNLIVRGNNNWVLLESPTSIADTGNQNVITTLLKLDEDDQWMRSDHSQKLPIFE
jgi:ribosomal protein S8